MGIFQKKKKEYKNERENLKNNSEHWICKISGQIATCHYTSNEQKKNEWM